MSHAGKEMMKVAEDPWDNFLYYDSKYVLPIICHASDMPIEKQILVAMFIQKSVDDEVISQYKVQGPNLINALFKFVEEEHGFLSTEAGQEAASEDEDEDIVDELLKIKSSKRGSKAKSLLDKLRECSVSKGTVGRAETM